MSQVTLHYIHRADAGKILSSPLVADDMTQVSKGGRFALACMPEQTFLSVSIRATDALGLVNCDKCKDTEVYKQAVASPPAPEGAKTVMFAGVR